MRIIDKAAAEGFVAGLIATIRELEGVLSRDMRGVRAGRLREALAESERKTALSAAYVNALEAANSNLMALARFTLASSETLEAAHCAFAAAVETNQPRLCSRPPTLCW